MALDRHFESNGGSHPYSVTSLANYISRNKPSLTGFPRVLLVNDLERFCLQNVNLPDNEDKPFVVCQFYTFFF
jgi:hypothetical protein